MIKPVIVLVASIGMALGAGTASARDHGSWHNGHQKHKPEWQVREEQRQRKQAQWERDQEWQRQQQEELRRRAEQQRLRAGRQPFASPNRPVLPNHMPAQTGSS